MWQFWVDRGGTFTDVVAKKPDGNFVTHKLLSENPEQYQDAATHAIRNIMQLKHDELLPQKSIESVKMGTTVATNALLERKGCPTLLLITKGFADLLKIGYQNRPKLFALNVVLPQNVCQEVEEVDERLDAKGKIVQKINVDKTREILQKVFDKGLRAVSIAFMHSYLNPCHEIVVAKIAKEVGFEQISTSHGASRLIKIVSRADTCVADAYLSPILRKYIQQVRKSLDVNKGTCQNVFFMQSNGGLIEAELFQGKDAILSGPAGGVVGMVETAKNAGFDKIIGFDMGGTSTDVSHFAGAYERSFETEIDGVRLRAPMMKINTVAAGGGSILFFRQGRYQVGPESAGATPGPACYRRNGPLTVTDCNLVLGKINPDYFPAVFGKNADQKLDAEIVKLKFLKFAKKIAVQNNTEPLSIEKTAEGFLKIAIENMANAIKKISVQCGYDVTKYIINCFGGAAGQHACLVADALGVKTVFIHPFAGVLSAYGIGLASIRSMQQQQFDQMIEKIDEANEIVREISEKVKNKVLQQGIEEQNIKITKNAYLKYEGSFQALEVKIQNLDLMKKKFEQEHLKRFGFLAKNRKIVFEMISVEAVAQAEKIKDHRIIQKIQENKEKYTTKAYMGGKWQTVQIIRRENLKIGQIVKGPAIITENNSTNTIENNWQATIDEKQNLVLQRYQEDENKKLFNDEKNPDPIMLEIFNNLFMSIAEQMGATLANTACSINIKERLDFSCALFDQNGDLVANAPHMPVHLGSMSESVRTVARINKGKIKPGDSFMLNAPFNGGTHLPDITVITPVFDQNKREILFYVGSRGHHADVGGRTPGSAPPDSKHIKEEGVVIDNFKIVDQGIIQEKKARELLASGIYPCRNINDNIADIQAQVAANATGALQVNKMIKNFSLRVVMDYMKYVQNNAQEQVRKLIGKLQDGQFRYEIDNGLHIDVKISVDKKNRNAIIDFSQTSKQHEGNYNAPLSICRAAVLYVFRTLVGSEIPLNEGCLKPLKIIAPPGLMINPLYPAAVIAGNTEVSQAITECLLGALGALAGSQGTMNNFVWGNQKFQNYETIAGGTGAGNGFNGTDAVHSHMTNTRMTDPEVLEKKFPVRIESIEIRKNSGGKGKWKGGNGIKRKITFFEKVTVTTLSSNRKNAPFGVEGGENGARGENWAIIKNNHKVNRVKLKGNDEIVLNENDAFEILTPGGGAWGK